MMCDALLVEWCTRHRIAVKMRKGAQWRSNYDHRKRKIVASSHSDRSRSFMLIHECGHAVLRNRTNYWLETSPFRAQHTRAGTVEGNLSEIHEEFQAWEEGLKLAVSLGCFFDREALDRTRALCLRSYMEQHLFPHRYK